MAMKGQSFRGANVFISRNLVPPEIFDTLHDALKLNAAQVFLCCDPSRNGPNDFHVISSPNHEKFGDLKANGCNMLGPQCVLSCAKENRALPRRGYTCCLAMDGVKVLASGFDMNEKAEMLKMVEAMGGVMVTKATLDVSFVIVKNVLAAKYKWALNISKKPVVTVNWLHQCWNEHRVVPQESHRVNPFSGLMISVTRIPAAERKEVERLIIQNGGKYSAELTKKCTHLICDAPEGDKYKVARRWKHIHTVSRKWFDQSIARRACLDEESCPVSGFSTSVRTASDCFISQSSQENKILDSQHVPSSVAADSGLPDIPFTWSADPDFETALPQESSCVFSEAPISKTEGDSGANSRQQKNETNLDASVANDSLSDENDLYLSECRILLVGLEASEMRKMVSLVRRGGGSRYMSFNDKLTHIVVGAPSEVEKKEIRSFAASGVISVVKTTWLEDCDREKKELPVFQRHVAYDVLVSKDSACSYKTAIGTNRPVQGKTSTVNVNMPSNREVDSGVGINLEPPKFDKCPKIVQEGSSLAPSLKLPQNRMFSAQNETIGHGKVQHDTGVQDGNPPTVFKGKTICFSSSFPEDRRAEIIQWVNQGGGKVVGENVKRNVHFTIECHGVVPRSSDISRTTYVSSHWIRSCLEVGRLLDISSHIIYSPLPCQIPLPGFENFRFCVSQYEDQDRLLLRNLCFVVGAKFVEKLTKKVTHLLCKFKIGQKYEAACKWGIRSITPEWIYECIKLNKVIPTDSFGPKEVTAQHQEAELYAASQYPTQAFKIISGEIPSQKSSQSQETQRTSAEAAGTRNVNVEEKLKRPISLSKRARLLKDDSKNAGPLPGEHLADYCKSKLPGQSMPTDVRKHPSLVPDVADVIEDLLEQTYKIHDVESPDKTNDKSLFLSDSSVIPQNHSESISGIGLSKSWLSRTENKDDDANSSQDVSRGVYDGFSETQTESQVVGYEEDLSGRQMLIDRVRTRSSLS